MSWRFGRTLLALNQTLINKSRKSKKNPVTSLIFEQKVENQQLSGMRTLMENVFASMKRLNALVHNFRNPVQEKLYYAEGFRLLTS